MMEATSSSTLSGQQSLQQQGEANPVGGDEEGSNFSVDRVCQFQDPVPRHCKRRRSNSVARLGDAAAPPPLARVEDPSMVAARMSILEIDRKEGMKGRRELPTKTAIGACVINSAPVQTDPESSFTLQSIWNEQVRSYLMNNPLSDEVMAEYLQCQDQLEVQQPPERSLSNTDSSRDMRVTSNTSVPSPMTTSDLADSHPGNEGRPGVPTRSKAHKKTIESAQPKSVEWMLQKSTGNLQMVSASNDVAAADPSDLQQATHARFQDSSHNEAQLDDRGKPFLGCLQARQAKILAEAGFQQGVRCARRDIGRNWRCPLEAVAGSTNCEHHKAKSRAKYARQKLRKRSRSSGQKIPELETGRSMKLIVTQPTSTEIMLPQPKLEDHAASTQVEEEAKTEALVNVQVNRSVRSSLKALQAKIRAEKGDESGVRCARTYRGKRRKQWHCPMNAMKGHTLCDHHYYLQEENNAAKKRRKAAAKRQGNSDFKNANNNGVGVSGSHTQFDQVSAEVPQLSLPLKPIIDTPSQAASNEKLDHTEAPDKADEISEDDHDDHADSDSDQLLPDRLKNASNCKRWYVASRKTTDAHVDGMKVNSHDQETSSGLILSLAPQPAMNGGRKAQLFRSLLKSL